MERIAKLLGLLCLVLALTGCVTVENQPFNKAAQAHIKTIVILPPPAVPEYSINIMHHPGAGFGLIGGLVAAAELTSKGTQLTESMRSQKFDVARSLTDAIRSEVEGRGYNVVVLDDLKRPEKKLLENYAALPVKGDAYLDLVITIAGYWANSHTTPYYPMLSAPVRLVNAKDRSVVYNSLILYGIFAGPKGATRIVPDASHAVRSFDELTASPVRSVAGLQAAVRSLARQIAADL